MSLVVALISATRAVVASDGRVVAPEADGSYRIVREDEPKFVPLGERGIIAGTGYADPVDAVQAAAVAFHARHPDAPVDAWRAAITEVARLEWARLREPDFRVGLALLLVIRDDARGALEFFECGPEEGFVMRPHERADINSAAIGTAGAVSLALCHMSVRASAGAIADGSLDSWMRLVTETIQLLALDDPTINARVFAHHLTVDPGEGRALRRA